MANPPSYKVCADLIFKNLESKHGEKLKSRDVETILKDLADTRSKLYVNNPTANMDLFAAHVQERLEQIKLGRAMAAKEATENLIKRESEWNRLQGVADLQKDPVRAVTAALLGGETTITQGGNLSVRAEASGRAANMMSKLDMGIKETGAEDAFKAGALDNDIRRELHTPGSSKNTYAASVAKVIKGIQKESLKLLQAAGSSIGEIQNYMGRQIHSYDLVSKVSKEEWVNYLYSRLDVEKSFGTMDPKERLRILTDTYDDILAGNWGTKNPGGEVSDRFITVASMSKNVGKSRARSFHFKDADSFIEYNEKFGGMSVLEDTLKLIHRAAGDSAVMSRFGTNPEGTIAALRERLGKALPPGDANRDTLLDFKGLHNPLNRDTQAMMGEFDRPGLSTAAIAAARAREVVAVAKTGSAVFSSLPDFAITTSLAETINGKTFLGNAARVASHYMKNVPAGDRARIASRIGVAMEGMSQDLLIHYGAKDMQPGMWAKTVRLSQKLSLMDAHVTRGRFAIASFVSQEFADHAGQALDSLPLAAQSTLKRYDIRARDWDLIRGGLEDINGSSHITLEAMKAVDDGTAPAESVRAQQKWLSLVNDYANMGTSTAQIRQKSWMGKNEGIGILFRLMGQFRTVLGVSTNAFKRVAFSNPELQPQQWRQLAKSDAFRTSRLMLGSAAMGAAGLALYDISRNKTPRDFTDPKHMMEVVAKSGMGGLYGDIVFGEATMNPAGLLGGPVIGQAFDLAKVYANMRNGLADDSDNVGKNLAKGLSTFALGAVPLQNLFYTKAAYDRLITFNVKSALNDNWEYEEEAKTAEAGQSYLSGALSPDGR